MPFHGRAFGSSDTIEFGQGFFLEVKRVQLELDSTICAIATGGQGSLRGAIRISGQGTQAILQGLFPGSPDSTEGSERFTQVRSARRIPTTIRLSTLGVIPISVFYWPDQRSYTGQPSAELHLLGAPVLLEEVQALVLAQGARLAQPGEFTLRAYLAGRLDLTQCEAVLGLIHAKGERSFQVALTQLAGGLATPLKGLRRDLINLLADIEAGLDFVDEDIEFVARDEIIERLERAEQEVAKLREQLEHRRGQSVECQVAVVGLPNAGKSSLVNALSELGSTSDAGGSIVSDQPGTTRDFVRSRLTVDDVVIDLIDTAGIEEVLQDGPRSLAQAVTWNKVKESDWILWCIPADETAGDGFGWLGKSLLESCDRVWGVVTKADLLADSNRREAWFDGSERVERAFRVSSTTGSGVAELRSALVESVRAWQRESTDVVPMTGMRCRASLARAAESLQQAREAVVQGSGEEIVAGELRLALEELGQVAGTVANNDILDALFSRFCIGK